MHSEHSTGHRVLVAPVTLGIPGAPVTPSAPVKPGAPVTPVNTGQKAQEVQDTQLLDRSELVRPVQLEHNVHESFNLLNSDSPDDRADESPERSILRHAGHRSLHPRRCQGQFVPFLCGSNRGIANISMQ